MYRNEKSIYFQIYYIHIHIAHEQTILLSENGHSVMLILSFNSNLIIVNLRPPSTRE